MRTEKVNRKYTVNKDGVKRESFTVSMPPATINAITKKANSMGVSRSKLIEQLIENFLRKEN